MVSVRKRPRGSKGIVEKLGLNPGARKAPVAKPTPKPVKSRGKSPTPANTASKGDKKHPEKVRVWWSPSRDRKRSDFGGAYWPAVVLSKSTNKWKVRYDNGDEEDVLLEHISPAEVPVDFGKEKEVLQVGEFCEVYNGSKTDPCAWLGKVAKHDSRTKTYMVDYPFHDSNPEKIEASRVRRARLMENKEWLVIKPNQTWDDGEVTSPKELELIEEEDIPQYLGETKAEPSKPKGKGKAKAEPAREPPAAETRASKRGRPAKEDKAADKEDRKGKEEGPSSKVVKGEKGEKPGPAQEVQAKRRGRPPKEAKEQLQEGGAASSEAGAPKSRAPAEKRAGPAAAPAAPAPAPAAPAAAAPAPGPVAGPGAMFNPALMYVVPTLIDGKTVFVPVEPGRVPPPNAVMVAMPAVAANMVRPAAAPPAPAPVPAPAPAAPQAATGSGLLSASAAKPPIPPMVVGPGVEEEPKKKRQKKDPAMPKKPKSAWNVFMERNRKDTAASNPEMPFHEVNKVLAEKWKAASPEERAACEAEAERDRQRYDKEMSEYSANAAPKSKEVQGPAPPRTAQALFTADLMRQLAGSGGGEVRDPAAAWVAASAEEKARYKGLEEEDKRRYEREVAAALAAGSPGPSAAVVGAAAPGPQPATPAAAGPLPPASSLPFRAEEIDDILNKGIDMKKMKRRFWDHGFTHEAYMMLVDVWRKESPRLSDALRSYQAHIQNRARPNWETFMVSMFGLDKVQALKKLPGTGGPGSSQRHNGTTDEAPGTEGGAEEASKADVAHVNNTDAAASAAGAAAKAPAEGSSPVKRGRGRPPKGTQAKAAA
mmetsp:Transcript_25093/g.54568  ORF Transcript_25093/g.54568 Transcript_25093/m.54568 type:complete len:820 (+) Transcript_25093:133-2592(+)